MSTHIITPSSTLAKDVHPFDQLSADEIADVAQLTRQAKPEIDFVFNTITLKEPKKEVMLSYLGWDTSKPRVAHVEREALVIALEKKTVKVYEAVVSLTTRKLKSWTYVPDVQPILTMDEMFEVEELVLKDEKVIQECRELGITDMSCVFNDPWAIARHISHPGRGKRLMQALMYMRTAEDDNQYAHPLDFVPIVGKLKTSFLCSKKDINFFSRCW
jgi:primary-amine oxidase